MKKIKINYYDFGNHFDAENAYFTKLLRTKYDVEISDEPDYIFYTIRGNKHHTFDGIRIFWSGEQMCPNFNVCDYAFGHSYLTFEDRYMRFPLWAMGKENIQQALHRAEGWTDEQLLNRKFCDAVLGNGTQTDGARPKMLELLEQYKTVDYGGKYHNTVGHIYPPEEKVGFQRNYKFSIAFENTYCSGYTMEKLIDSFASHHIPLYYGNPRVAEEFNPKAFINAHDFNSLEEMMEYVKKVDQDDALYLQMVREPVFQPGALERVSDEKVLEFLSHIFDQPYEKARRHFYSKPYIDTDIYHLKQRDVNDILKAYIKRQFAKLWHKKKQ